MIGSSLLSTGLVTLACVVLFGTAIWEYRRTGSVSLWAIAGAFVASGAIVSLLVSNDYVPETILTTNAGWVLSGIGAAVSVVAFRRHDSTDERSDNTV